jgi:hypothetical protein
MSLQDEFDPEIQLSPLYLSFFVQEISKMDPSTNIVPTQRFQSGMERHILQLSNHGSENWPIPNIAHLSTLKPLHGTNRNKK